MALSRHLVATRIGPLWAAPLFRPSPRNPHVRDSAPSLELITSRQLVAKVRAVYAKTRRMRLPEGCHGEHDAA